MAKYQRKADLLIAMQIREDMKKHHEDYLDRIRHDHEHAVADVPDPPAIEVLQNDSESPIVLSNGVVVLPGHYYAESSDFTREPFGISDEELASEYVEVTD